MTDYEVYYVPHQFTGQPVPARRPVRREVKPVISPLEATLRQLEAACKLQGVMMADADSYTQDQKDEVKADVKRLHEAAIADAAEGML